MDSWRATHKVCHSTVLKGMQRTMVAGWGGVPLVGTAEQIVTKLQDLHRIGVDGVAMTWVNYVEGISSRIQRGDPSSDGRSWPPLSKTCDVEASPAPLTELAQLQTASHADPRRLAARPARIGGGR